MPPTQSPPASSSAIAPEPAPAPAPLLLLLLLLNRAVSDDDPDDAGVARTVSPMRLKIRGNDVSGVKRSSESTPPMSTPATTEPPTSVSAAMPIAVSVPATIVCQSCAAHIHTA